MTRAAVLISLAVALGAAGGCTSLPAPDVIRGQAPVTESDQLKKNDQPADKKDDEKKNGKENGNENGKEQEEKPEGPPKTLFEWAIGPKEEKKEPEEEEPIISDRPDFTEAARTVGL